MPLQQPVGVRERAVLLGVRGRGQEEDLRRDLVGAQLARLDLRRVAPERRALGLDEIAHDEPLQLREGEALELAVCGSDGWVLADEEEALTLRSSMSSAVR